MNFKPNRGSQNRQNKFSVARHSSKIQKKALDARHKVNMDKNRLPQLKKSPSPSGYGQDRKRNKSPYRINNNYESKMLAHKKRRYREK